MKSKKFKQKSYKKFLALSYFALALLLACTPVLFLQKKASAVAGQISPRKVAISSAQPDANSDKSYTFTFTITSTNSLKGLKFIACDSAVGTYGRDASSTCASGSAPTGLSFSSGPAAWVSQTGFGTNGTSFARDGTGSTYCTPAANVLCASRASSSAETATSHTITYNQIKNPSTANTTFYIGIYTYQNTSDSVAQDEGTVATATSQLLTVNAAVAEVLSFCVGSTAVDDATTNPGNDCSDISGTSVNLGTLDTSHVNITPVTTNCSPSDCNKNGIAMVRSNAATGVAVFYDSIQASGGSGTHKGSLRKVSGNCSADAVNLNTSNTDECFNVRTAQTTFTSNTERFGMTIAGINCGSTVSYTCTFSSGTYNLLRDAVYDGTGGNTYNTSDKDQTITGTTNNGYAWDESGATVQIADSSTSTVKQVDDESLILKFAGTPNLTTPFGTYTASVDFVVVATY